jgi:hypothetical protein
MPGPPVIERLVADVARQIRLRRAEFYGLRGLLWGAVAAVVPLVLKEPLGIWSYVGAAILLLAGAGVGALRGLLMKLPPAEAARLADRGYGLQDRVSTALEWAGRADRTPIVEALVTDAAARADRLGARASSRRVPRGPVRAVPRARTRAGRGPPFHSRRGFPNTWSPRRGREGRSAAEICNSRAPASTGAIRCSGRRCRSAH